MANQDLNRLKLERTQLRRKFTEVTNILEPLLEEDVKDIKAIEELAVKATDKAERLFRIDQSVSDVLYTIVEDEEELSREFDAMESYRDRWIRICHLKDELLAQNRQHVDQRSLVSTSSSESKKRLYNLPKLEVEKFDGNIKNWIKFWTPFRKIHEDERLDEEDKFQYLIQSTLKGSPARELLDSFPPSASNYLKAVNQLKKRFGRDELLIELYVRELLNLVLAQANKRTAISLRKLYDNLETQLRSLESLGVTSDKYACMLLPLVESALPESVLRDWERVKCRLDGTHEAGSGNSSQLDELLIFLRREVECEERIYLARSNFSCKIKTDCSQKEQVPTAADLMTMKRQPDGCIFCKGLHNSERCYKARDMTLEEVHKILRENGRCFLCLRKGHVSAKCKINVRCISCKKRHSSLLCPDRRSDMKKKGEIVEQTLSNTSYDQVLLQTLRVKVLGDKTQTTARLLIDTGSQRSYITKRLASLMRYKPLNTLKLSHALFGGTQTENKTHSTYKVRLESLVFNYACNFEVIDTDIICQKVPIVGRGLWVEELDTKGITLSDVEEGPIDILVGADVAGKLFTGKREVLSCGLVAMETLLGFVIMGRVKDNDNHMVNINMHCANPSVEDLWRLDVLGIEDPVQQKSKSERLIDAEQHFTDTVTILPDGRYEVKLPWIDDHPPLPSNFELAKKRLDTTVSKLKSANLEMDYEAVFNDWLNEEIIEEVSTRSLDIGHYLPHRPVIKEGSTTRIRPVFDASAHCKGRVSLNQCLEKGTNLIELIPNILLKFRFDRIGVISDVKKAFLQISINKEDRDFLRFLWTDRKGDLKIFRHKRVVFGVTCSPFLLSAVFRHHLCRCEQLSVTGEAGYSTEVISKLQGCFYVDNCVTSVRDKEKLTNFIDESSSIFQAAKFELRGWEFTDPDLRENCETPVLGMIWNKQRDTFKINVPQLEFQCDKTTRRILLSASQKLFDPVGLTSPTALIPKLLIQQTWVDKGDWDQEVDEVVKVKFSVWLNELHHLKEIEIPRWIKATEDNAHYSLHTFCDASQVAYATVCFLRVECRGTVMLYLLGAKTRVSPIKPMTIPRLELLAATIGARLANSILKDLNVEESIYWTDSMTALTWIQQEEPWGVFVANRVHEIRKLSNIGNWRHVPGSLNPADLASRGCSPYALLQSKWWEGPEWLLENPTFWPSRNVKPDEKEVKTELRKSVISNCNVNDTSLTESLIKGCSKYTKMVRVIAWIDRFIYNCQNPKKRTSGVITAENFCKAEKKLLRILQIESFAGSSDKRLENLNVFLDSEGLIRLKTRILNRKDSEEFRTPLVLPSNNLIVDRLIIHKHCASGHMIGQGLINLLREEYWVIKARQTVKRVVSKCVICKRYSAKNFSVETPPLPENRVKDASVFEVTGIDLFGPLYVRDGKKLWICIFTCAVYRAIHLEIVSSMSTETFVLALRRFIARRGRPSVIYSDNGTNFKGLHNAFQKVNWDEVTTSTSMNKIEWRFNPPTAAWWGGFWERLIGILKNMLRKTLGKTCLTEEELFTVLCECESLINARPITYTSADNEDPIPISPKMFLQEINTHGYTEDFDNVDRASLNRKLKYKLQLKEELRKRFRTEYLGQLVQNQSKVSNTREPIVGEVVLLGSDTKKRFDWPLGVVLSKVHGKDGRCRVVYLKTADGTLCRPIQKVFPLEITPTPESSIGSKMVM